MIKESLNYIKYRTLCELPEQEVKAAAPKKRKNKTSENSTVDKSKNGTDVASLEMILKQIMDQKEEKEVIGARRELIKVLKQIALQKQKEEKKTSVKKSAKKSTKKTVKTTPAKTKTPAKQEKTKKGKRG